MKRFVSLLILPLVLIFALTVTLAAPAAAQQQSDADVISRINRVAASLSTIECDFTQTRHISMLNDKMTSKGKMYYQRSDKLRWQYTSPYAYTFIVNGAKVSMKSKGRTDVVDASSNAFFKELVRIMAGSVTGRCLSSDKDFKVALAVGKTEYVATLTPRRRQMQQLFKNVVLHFDKARSMVSRIELVEKNGDRTVIALTNVRTNHALNASLFSLD